VNSRASRSATGEGPPPSGSRSLIHDWNTAQGEELRPARGGVELCDETLRDGLQSPSVRTPSIDDKLRILHLLAEIGVESLDIGLPGAGPHVAEHVERLAREIADHKLPIRPTCAARTVRADIEPIIDISQKTGLEVEVACFLGSSPIRQYAEAWDMDRLLRLTREAVALGVGSGLPVMYVTEDTTRSTPEDLRRIYGEAVEAGAARVCIADTVGHATPNGARNLVRFIRSMVDGMADGIMIDWHGHDDRGIGLINTLVAGDAGADRLHGTVLGIGERVGNCPLDLLLVNLELLGWIDEERRRDLSQLQALCELVGESTGRPLPDDYPVFGRDAFRTATGVHAAAIIKSRAKGDDWLADRIYSGVPAALFGRRQVIEVGPMSGESNVRYWLQERGIDARPDLVTAIFTRAKEADGVLTESEILAICSHKGLASDS
jgi:2-isopropylmalate synthase